MEERVGVYRILCVIAIIAIPLFGLFYRYTTPSAIDPMWNRLAMTVLPVGLLTLSFAGKRYWPLFCKLMVAFIYLVMVWFTALTMVNGLSPNYAVGLLFVFAILSISRSVGLRDVQPLARFLLFSVGVMALPLSTIPDLEISRFIFLTCIVGLGSALYVILRARIHAENKVAFSEQQHRSFVEKVPVGVYRVVPDGEVLFANNALVDMMGYASLREFKDEATLRSPAAWSALEAQFDDEGTVRQREATWTRRDGTPVHVLESARRVCDPDGATRYYEGIVEDISARKEQQQKLVEAKEKAEEMNQLKTAFLANMSHEIRTPLTSILGYAEILVDEVTDEGLREFATSIERSGARLRETLNSVLALSKLEAGSVQVDPEAIDVAGEVKDIVKFFEPRADEKDITLRMLGPDSMEAMLDTTLVHRVVNNVVSNAVKFTERGGCVTVRVGSSEEKMGEQVVIEIEDTGVGIEKGAIADMFVAFKQESTGTSRVHKGAGLGLTIAYRLTELMNGSIEIDSTKGEGTCVTVRLPRSPECAEAEHSVSEEDEPAHA